MAIDFPPPPTPLQGDPVVLQADAHEGAVTVTVAGYTLYVHAPGVLDESDIQAATAGMEDLSAAVRALSAVAQNKGVLVPRTLYARVGNDIYVSVSAGKVRQVSAPPELMPYFSGLTTAEAPTVQGFERSRILGGIHASRMAYDLTPVFTPAEGDTYDMTLKPGTEVVNPGSVKVNFSNTGNRFTGREFLDLDARRGDSWGDEFSVLARTAATVFKFDDKEPGSDYHESQLGWSRVTPYGLFGASGHYVDYRQQVLGTGFNGELWTVDASWTDIAFASTTHRVTVLGKLDYTHKNLKVATSGQLVQKEPYPSVELGAAWSTSLHFWNESWLSVAGLSARKGFGNATPSLTVADLGYWLVRPTYSLRSQGNPWVGELQLGLQYSDATVPEQQQWVLGGVNNLNAYVPGVAIGDRGLLVRLVGEHTPWMLYGLSFKPKAFVEFGAAEFSKDIAGRPSGTQSVTDVGGEVVIGLLPWLETALTAALPVQDSGIAKQTRDDTRSDFFFRLTAKF